MYLHGHYERYPPAPKRMPDSSWRPRGRKRRDSLPPSFERPRHRASYEHPDHQREAAEFRVRQQLQGVHLMQELCSKETYQRYQTLSGDKREKTTAYQSTAFQHAIQLAEFPEAREMVDVMESIDETLKKIEEKRLGPYCVRTDTSSILLDSKQADVLRMYESTTKQPSVNDY